MLFHSVNLLLIGEDDVIISRLLHYGSQFAHRSVLHSHQTDLTGCVHKEDKHYSIDGKLYLSNGHLLHNRIVKKLWQIWRIALQLQKFYLPFNFAIT